MYLKHKSSASPVYRGKEHHDRGNGWEEGPQDLESSIYCIRDGCGISCPIFDAWLQQQRVQI